MKLGFMTNILAQNGMKSLTEISDWALENGFEDMEVGPLVPLDEGEFGRALDKGISITALAYCRNYLSTDEEEAALHLAELKKRILFASGMGIEKVVTSTGIDKSVEEGVYDRADAIRKIPARSFDAFCRVFEPIVELAEEKKVKVAFENCPLMGNIAISPVMWEMILKKFDSPYVGLAFDPSHLVWQFIDPYRAAEAFSERILHVHAKDTVIDRERLSESGILTDFRWWSYKIPGRGELDWKRLFGILRQAGYDGTISLEHEDAEFAHSLEEIKTGMLEARDYIRTMME